MQMAIIKHVYNKYLVKYLVFYYDYLYYYI